MNFVRVLLLVAALCSGRALASQLPGSSAARSNDVHVPTLPAALEAMAEGDEEFLRAMDAGPAMEGHLASAFEAWHRALVSSGPGDSVPTGIRLNLGAAGQGNFDESIEARWPDRDRSFLRRTEAVEYAVLRRLSALDAPQRSAWQARFGALAEARLELASNPSNRGIEASRLGFEDLERQFPGTPAALKAALWLFELNLEEGHPRAARVWLERAQRHGQFFDPESTQTNLEGRWTMLDQLTRPPRIGRPRWSTAAQYSPQSGHPLVGPNMFKPAAMARIEGKPGLAFLGDGRVVVQTTGTCWLLSLVDHAQKRDRIFEPWRLAHELGHPIARTVDRTGRDWQLYPLVHDDVLFLITGRADGMSSNLLQRIRPPAKIDLPVAEWSLGGEGLFHKDGSHHSLAETLGSGLWEFQPGPIVVEGTLFVQARQWAMTEVAGTLRAASPGEAKVWLLALDARSGLPRWKRFLCRGSDLTVDFGSRFETAQLIRTPAQPLRATTTAIFCGTNLGAGFLVEIADGRLITSFANDRRDAGEEGWQSAGRPQAWETAQENHPVLLWAPSDGRRLLSLRADLDFAMKGEALPLVAHLPLALGESEVLLGGTPSEVLVLGRAGSRRTLSAHDLTTGARIDSVYFGRSESLLGSPLISGERVLFATDGGLYRLDRTRELYLEAFQSVRMKSDFAPGGLWARGEDLYLLAGGRLFRFGQ